MDNDDDEGKDDDDDDDGLSAAWCVVHFSQFNLKRGAAFRKCTKSMQRAQIKEGL